MTGYRQNWLRLRPLRQTKGVDVSERRKASRRRERYGLSTTLRRSPSTSGRSLSTLAVENEEMGAFATFRQTLTPLRINLGLGLGFPYLRFELEVRSIIFTSSHNFKVLLDHNGKLSGTGICAVHVYN